MFLIKLVRKLGKTLRGGAGDREIFLGGLVGACIGMIPGFNLTLVLTILAFLLLNANVGVAVLGFALGKVFCIVLASITFEIGYVLIHSIGLEGLFRLFADTPVLALLDLHYYCLVGGLPIAAVVGVVFGVLMKRSITALRTGVVEAVERSEKMQKLANNKLVRFVLWLVFGKQKEDMADILAKNQPFLRKSGLALVGGAIVILLVLEFLLLDMGVKAGLEIGLASATGAEVNVDDAHLSIFGGKLALKGIQVTDSAKPTHNLVQAETVAADLSVSALLAKRYVVDLLEASNVTMDAERDKPGKVYEKKTQDEAEEEEEPKDAVTKYLEKAKDLKKHLKKVKEWLEKQRSKEKGEEEKTDGDEKQQKEDLKELADTVGYLRLSAKNVLATRPTWVVRKVKVDGIVVAKGFEAHNLEAAELSSHPELNPNQMTMTLTPTKGGPPTAALNFHFEKPNLMHQLKLSLQNVALGKGLKLTSDAPLDVQEGTADLGAEGKFSRDKIVLPFNLVVQNLKAKAQEGKSVLGLDPQTAQQVFGNLEELKIPGALEGSLTSPSLKLDHKAILGNLKEALLKAGKAELAKRAGEQLQRVTGQLEKALGDKIPVDVKKMVGDKLPGGLTDKIPLFGGKKEQKPGAQEEEKKEKPKAKDLLKKLF